MFTRTLIEEIIEKIALYGRKDSELPLAIIPLTKKEEISFVQNGRNVKMKLDDLVNNLLLFRATDFINISEKFDNKEFTLTEAVSVVAPINRKAGAFITFIDSTTKDWAIYQFKGNSELEWLQLDLWNNVLQTIDNHFKGYFVNEAALEGEHPMPTIGDYAFVGTTYRNAVIYKCITRWSWSVTSDTMSYIEIVPKGDFEEGVVYDKLNMVFYDYDAYISLNDNNTSLPTDSTKWFRSTNLKDLVLNIESIGDTIVLEESERVSAEIARVSAEEQRVSSETTRGDNEVIRQSNEQYRQQAESLRETEHTNKLNEADTAIDLANTATFNANTARDNLTDLVDSKITEANNKILDIESRTASAISDTNDATTAANTAAGNANDAADAANTAAGLADTARLAIQDDLASKADQTELDQLAGELFIQNGVNNGNFSSGDATDWAKSDLHNVVFDAGIGKYVLTGGSETAVVYTYQDIIAPEGHKLFISALAKGETVSPASSYVVVSEYGARTLPVRYPITSLNYAYVQMIHDVPAGYGGIRLHLQTNVGYEASITDFLVIDLTEIYEDNIPPIEELQAFMSKAGGYFDKLNILEKTKADKSYVDNLDETKADKSELGLFITKLETSDIINGVKQARFKTEDYSLLLGDDWGDGFFIFQPIHENETYKLKITSNSILGVDFSTLVDKYSGGRATIVLEMSEVKNIDFIDNTMWADNKPMFDEAGIYVLNAVENDGKVIMSLQSYAEIAEPLVNVIYVDNSAHTEVELYPSSGGLITETATRTTSSWENPYIYLQNAINDAQEGDEIWVKNGVIKPTHLYNTATYNSGDCKSVDAVFTVKSGVNIYGGFGGTELTKEERVGSKTILSGDINNQVTTLETVVRGDRRNVNERSLCSKNLVRGAVSVMTYIDSFEFQYVTVINESGAVSSPTNRKLVIKNCHLHDVYGGAAAHYVTIIDCIINNCENTTSGGGALFCYLYNCEVDSCMGAPYAGGIHYSSAYNIKISNCYAVKSGGGVHSSIVRSARIFDCVSDNNGGGAYRSTIYDSVVEDCQAANQGGGWFNSTVFRSSAIRCSATSRGGGWSLSRATQCIAYMCQSNVSAGWMGAGSASFAVNCVAVSCKTVPSDSAYDAGFSGLNTNCAAINCEAPAGTGAWNSSQPIINCAAINCVGIRAVRRVESDMVMINTLLFNNKNVGGGAVGMDTPNTAFMQIMKNCAYDTSHPVGTATGVGSDFDKESCIEKVTLNDLKIDIPSFVGYANTPEKVAELDLFVDRLQYKMKPQSGSILIGGGVNYPAYPSPSYDYYNRKRGAVPSIGLLE